MANYPPTPSFGGFDYHGHFAPPPPPGSNNMIHYPTYPQQRDAVYPHQGPPVPPIMPYGNAYAFNANAQTPNTNFLGSGVHPPPSPAFQGYGQHQSTSAPPPHPPFPPVPLPSYSNVPQRFATSGAPVPSSSTLQPHTSLPPKPPPLSAQIQSLGQAGTRSEMMFGADREDGELSDGDLHRPGQATKLSSSSSRSDLERGSKTEAIPGSMGSTGQDGTFITGKDIEHPEYSKARHHGALRVGSLPHSQPNSISPDQDQHSFTNLLEDSGPQSLNQRSVVHEVIDSCDEETSFVQQPSFSYSPSLNQAFVKGLRGDKSVLDNTPVESSRFGSMTQQQTSASDMDDKNKRECAKLVLQELYDHNIGFEKLLAEGINASLLRGLYQELDIAIPFLPLPQLDQRNTSNGTSATQANQDVDLASSGPLPTHESQMSERTLETPEQDKSRSTQGIPDGEVPHDQDASSRQSAATAAQNTVHAGTVPEPSHSLRINSANLPKKPVISTSVDKAIERKDYIAKMLAAKAGRNAAIAKPSRPAEPSALQLEVKDSHSKENSRKTASPAIPTRASLPVPLEKATNTEDTRRAQTELARRKIEALKARIEPHREEPPKSTQEPAPSPSQLTDSGLSPPTHERSPNISHRVLKEPPAPLQMPASEQSLSKPSPTPQFTPSRSFFSSLGRRPANGIPGLFSFSAPVSPPLSQQESIIPATSIANAIQAIPEQQIMPREQSTHPLSVVPIPQEDIDMDETHINSSIPVPASSVATSTPAPETTHEQSRKRPTAADFIESPATRVKRRLGSSEQVDVLIEISEDEDHSENDEMDIDNIPTSIAPPPPSGVAKSAKAKAIRDLPPLSDFPSRTKSQVSSFASTPPMVQTPGKVKEQEILKLKEEQISLMQRKIAEMEQRKKAKQAISRTQTPGMSSPRQVEMYSDMDTRTPSFEKGTDVNLDLKQSIKAADQKLQAQQAILVAAEEAVRKKQEADERHKHEVEERHRQEVEERRKQEVKECEKQQEEQRAKAVLLAQAESERAEVQKAKMLAESQERQKRKAELETALPELDIGLERTKYKLEETRSRLESMKKEIEELEADIERGTQGRGIIFKELDDIAMVEKETSVLVHQQPVTHTEDATDATGGESPVDHMDVANDTQIEPNGVDQTSPEPSILSASPNPQTLQHPPAPEAPPRHTETVDEIMDISSASSSSDEGEISDDSRREISVERQVLAEFDQSQGNYQPNAKDNTPPPPDLNPRSNRSMEDDRMMLACPPEPATEPILPAHEEESRTPKDVQMEGSNGIIDVQEQAEAHDDVILDIASDSDDYEPPESTSLVDNQAVSVNLEPLSPKSPSPTVQRIAEQRNALVPVSPEIKPPQKDDGKLTRRDQSVVEPVLPKHPSSKPGHFIPYESPLNVFTSYRYHPKYVSEVSSGFRSLTYSHKIDSDKPLCRWELAGGICNDDSCDGQHFRDMVLTDNRILVQLGSARAGSTQQQKEAYVAGLKEIIQDMRIRKVNDFTTVATEIAAYRTKFIGDGSSILPL